MLIYRTDKNKSIVVIVGQDVTEDQAIKKANTHFKVKADRLQARVGYIQGNGLYWDKPGKKYSKAWAVYKRGTFND